MSNPLLAKTFITAAAILAHRIVKFHTDVVSVVPATAVGNLSIGVTDTIDSASGDSVDVITHGIAAVTYGGTIVAGERLTAGTAGKAVKSTLATDILIGVALVSGVDGDVGSVKL